MKYSMRKTLRLAALGLLAVVGGQQMMAQVSVTGSVQSDMMVAPLQDERIGTSEYDNKYFLTNTYVDLMLQSKSVDAGGRFELTQWPMPGFATPPNEDFKGWGVPNLWVKGRLKRVELTMGSFYEQFGSGFILRTYEERTLGVDNSLTGGRAVITPVEGLQIKALSGVQRNYWEHNGSIVSGADVEMSLDQWIKPLKNKGMHLLVGGSWVNKWENYKDKLYSKNPGYSLNVPEFVNAFDARVNFRKGGFNILGEYAQKSQDPNSLNGNIYRTGRAAMLSATYSKKGLSVLLQTKRSDNMAFRSKRNETHSTTSFINHQPAFCLDHTYALAALYPYSTMAEGENNGEWAYQGSVGYNFKKKSALGGKYGTKLKLNYSLVKPINYNWHGVDAEGAVTDLLATTDGYGSAFWKWGHDTYYQDLDIQLEKKLSKKWDIHAMYMYQDFNRIIQKHEGHIRSHVFIFEPKWKINNKLTLRAEAQYLYTDHESGDWGFGLLELSVAPYLMFTVSDQIGRPEKTDSYGDVTHYYNFSVTGSHKGHRLQVGFGRTRAGVNCTGGVCRYIPASKGLTINYNYNF